MVMGFRLGLKPTASPTSFSSPHFAAALFALGCREDSRNV